MLVLALDTATPELSIALVDTASNLPLAERTFGAPSSHSSLLPGALADLLAWRSRSLSEVAGIAVGLGPGSFTGLRVGLATAKGLCYARRIPIAGASSLRAMAAAAAERVDPGALLVPCLHARRGEIYAGFFRAGSLEAEWDEIAAPPEALASRLGAVSGDAVVFGTGRRENPAILARFPRAPDGVAETPRALFVARLAGPWSGYDAARLFALEPHYIRPSEAEVKFPHGLAMSDKQKRAVRGARPRS